MSTPNRSLPLKQARQRIYESILREASTAAEYGDGSVIAWSGLQPELAMEINKLNEGGIARLARSLSNDAIQIRIDNRKLGLSLDLISTSSTPRKRQMLQLHELHASRNMVTELGFDVSCLPTDLQWKRGRPPELTRKQHKACDLYWQNLFEPERLDPVDILIDTCRFTGITANALWRFLGPEGGMSDSHRDNYNPFQNRASELAWIRTMFPRWNQLKHESYRPKAR